MQDWRNADLDEQERVMLEWVEKITFTPGQMTEEDVQRLRTVGFVDEDIVEIALICSYYNMVNRFAEALGAETGQEQLDGPVGQALPWLMRAR